MLVGTFLMLDADDGGDILRIDTATYSAVAVDPADATIQFVLNGTGGGVPNFKGEATQAINLAPATFLYDWVLPNTTLTEYYVRATLQAGSLTSGTTGVWLSLLVNQSWIVQRSITFGFSSATVLFELSANQVDVLESGVVTLTATVDI